LYFQTVFDYQHERVLNGGNGFNLTNIRLTLSGELDEGFGYSMQTNFINSKPILDAMIYHKFSKALRVDVGQFKAPFSSEYLTSDPQLDFVNRSQATINYSPKRQIGFQFRGNIVDELVSVTGGMFNGNGINTTNDDDKFMYVGRVVITPAIGEIAKLSISGNAAYNQVATDAFEGDRITAGGDLKLTVNDFMFYGEIIVENSKPDSGNTLNNLGYQVTAGYYLCKSIQVLGRLDVLEPDDMIGEKNTLAIIGCNYFPTEVTKLQFNYIVNTEQSQIKYNQILLAAQLAF
jgi:phosphate-selective porin